MKRNFFHDSRQWPTGSSGMPPKHVLQAAVRKSEQSKNRNRALLRYALHHLRYNDNLAVLTGLACSCVSARLAIHPPGPGETEAGSAGTQPDQGITRSRVCRKALPSAPGTGESRSRGSSSLFGHQSHALKIQPSPSRLLPLSPAAGLSTVAETYFMFLRSSIVNLALLFFSPGSRPSTLPTQAQFIRVRARPGELRWRLVVQRAMRSLLIVPPRQFADTTRASSGLLNSSRSSSSIPQTRMERLRIAVLPRRSLLDVQHGHPPAPIPTSGGIAYAMESPGRCPSGYAPGVPALGSSRPTSSVTQAWHSWSGPPPGPRTRACTRPPRSTTSRAVHPPCGRG